jgi:hypothetical protein
MLVRFRFGRSGTSHVHVSTRSSRLAPRRLRSVLVTQLQSVVDLLAQSRTLPPFGVGDGINCDQQTTTQIRLIWSGQSQFIAP